MTKEFWKKVFSPVERKAKPEGRIRFVDRLIALRNLPRLLRLVWKTSPSLTFFNALCRLTLSLLPVSILYVGKMVIDQVVFITHHKNASHAPLWKYVLIEFIFVIIVTALTKCVNLIDNLLSDLFSIYCSAQIMSHASTLDLEQFEDSAFYDKLERARQQSSGRSILLSQVLSQLQDWVTMIFLLIGLIVFNPWFTLILIISSVPSFLSESYFNSKNYELNRNQIQRRRELEYLTYLGASDLTAKEVKLFNLSDFLIKRFKTISKKLYADSRRLTLLRSRWGILLAIVAVLGYYAVFVYIINSVLIGTLTLGGLTFLLGSVRQMGGMLQNVIKNFSTVSQGAIYLKDFFDFFDIKPKIAIPAKPLPFPRPLKKGFVFEDVGFKYSNSNRWANRHLNFTLHAGEKLALVGENGAGKTTLVKLLARLYDPTEGRILLDDRDLREYDLTDLRSEIGIIFQDYLKYQMTTSENIAVGNISELENEELIKHSAKQSLASSIIERLPNQYDQMLGRHFSKGVELSGGEWQKIALARAYMRNSQLMILDEPTAALDARAEYEVFERFAELTKNKTAMLISHRFSTVRMADRILVLERGQLLEIGSHEELLEKDGRYAELFQLQARGYQ